MRIKKNKVRTQSGNAEEGRVRGSAYRSGKKAAADGGGSAAALSGGSGGLRSCNHAMHGKGKKKSKQKAGTGKEGRLAYRHK